MSTNRIIGTFAAVVVIAGLLTLVAKEAFPAPVEPVTIVKVVGCPDKDGKRRAIQMTNQFASLDDLMTIARLIELLVSGKLPAPHFMAAIQKTPLPLEAAAELANDCISHYAKGA